MADPGSDTVIDPAPPAHGPEADARISGDGAAMSGVTRIDEAPPGWTSSAPTGAEGQENRGAFPPETGARGVSVGAAFDDAVEREDLASYRTRLRAATSIGFFVYLLFGFTDYLIAEIAGSAFWDVFAIRLVFEALIGVPIAAIVWLDLNRTQLRVLDAMAYGLAALGVSVMCIPTGGFSSDYYAGVMLVHVCRNAFLSEHWKQTLLPSSLVVLSYPLALLGGALFLPELARGLGERAIVFQFIVQMVFISCNAFLVGWAGHHVWSLRRKVYESRALGRYRLEQRIGTGGMGEVWSATHPRLRRRVAIKILRSLPEGVDSVRRFEREVAATSQLSHPNTIRIFDYGSTEDGIFYYVMELLDGESLAELVAREGPLEPARAVFMIDQAARALAEAHQFGICHRDVKPENLFVTRTAEDGDFVKLLDFGVAKDFGSRASRGMTQTGAVIGTPDYLSPEVALGRGADARSDVYALGAVLFFCLTGRPPFEGETSGALLFSHINVRPPKLREVRGGDVDEDLDAIIARCLEKEPARRYEDAGALAIALSTTALFGRWRPALAGQQRSVAHSSGPPAKFGSNAPAFRPGDDVDVVHASATTAIEVRSPIALAQRVIEHPLSGRGEVIDSVRGAARGRRGEGQEES